MNYIALTVLSISLLGGPIFISQAQAQEDAAQEQNQSSQYGSMPHRGMTMVEVEQHFGKPLQMLDPVGKPPISRWKYEGFSVIFEHHFVIHAIATAD